MDQSAWRVEVLPNSHQIAWRPTCPRAAASEFFNRIGRKRTPAGSRACQRQLPPFRHTYRSAALKFEMTLYLIDRFVASRISISAPLYPIWFDSAKSYSTLFEKAGRAMLPANSR